MKTADTSRLIEITTPYGPALHCLSGITKPAIRHANTWEFSVVSINSRNTRVFCEFLKTPVGKHHRSCMRGKTSKPALIHLIYGGQGELVGMSAWLKVNHKHAKRDASLGWPEGLGADARKHIVRNLYCESTFPSRYQTLDIMNASLAMLPIHWIDLYQRDPLLAQYRTNRPTGPAYIKNGWIKLPKEKKSSRTNYWLKELNPTAKYKLGVIQLRSMSGKKLKGQLPIPALLLRSLQSVFQVRGNEDCNLNARPGRGSLSIAFMSAICGHSTPIDTASFAARLTDDQLFKFGIPYIDTEHQYLDKLHNDCKSLNIVHTLNMLAQWLGRYADLLPGPLDLGTDALENIFFNFASILHTCGASLEEPKY